MNQSPTRELIIGVLKAAQQAAMQQDYAQALMKYRWVEQHILDDEENLPLLRMEIGWTLYYLQQYPGAISYLQKVLESPNLNQQQVFDNLRLIGICHEYLGEMGKAIAFLEDALLQPVDEKSRRFAYFELGKIYFSLNKVEKARPALEKALPHFDDSELEYRQTTRYYLGLIAFFQKRLDAANAFFSEFLEAAPDEKSQAPGYFGMAHLYYEKAQFEALENTCRNIMSIDPDFYDKETIGFFLCRSYLGLGKWKQCREYLEQLQSAFPNGRYASEYPAIRDRLAENSA